MFTNLNINRHITKLNWLVTEKSRCQPQTNIAFRLADTISFAFIGAIGGALLSAIGSLISSSPFGIAAVIIIGIAIGSYAGGTGGGIYGVLAAGVGSLISSTALGVTLTILACACLAAWCTLRHRDLVWTRVDLKTSGAENREPRLTRRRNALSR